MNTDLVSIGFPTRNRSAHLKKAIKSLLAQTYPNFELIISDNASTDDTEAVCQNFMKKDKRIKYIRQTKNIGIITNYNFVLKKARGPYFMWASDDDFWDKDFIKELVGLFQEHKSAVLAVSNFDNIFGNKRFHNKPVNFDNNWSAFESLVHFIKTGELSFFYGLHKLGSIKKIGGYQLSSRPFFRSSDYLTVFLVLTGGKMVYTPKTLFFKRDTGFHFARFDIMKNLKFDKNVLRTMLRYLFFPLFFLYDCTTSTQYIILSDFNAVQKIILIYHTSITYFKRNLQFIFDVVLGVGYFFRGIKKLLKKCEK